MTARSQDEETHEHWWCRRCGRWEIVDDADICRECAFHVGTAALAALRLKVHRARLRLRRRALR